MDTDCVSVMNNSECSYVNTTLQCSCSIGYKTISDTCISNEIGDTGCTQDRECYNVIANSNCTSNTCYCNAGYYSSEDKSDCILRTIGDTCSNDGDCTYAMVGSLCEKGSCVCDASHLTNEQENGCDINKIDDPCSSSSNCEHITNSICDINTETCQCSHGYIQVENAECRTPILGEDQCEIDSQCTLPILNSICINGTCQCLEGYDENKDTSVCSPSEYCLKQSFV